MGSLVFLTSGNGPFIWVRIALVVYWLGFISTSVVMMFRYPDKSALDCHVAGLSWPHLLYNWLVSLWRDRPDYGSASRVTDP